MLNHVKSPLIISLIEKQSWFLSLIQDRMRKKARVQKVFALLESCLQGQDGLLHVKTLLCFTLRVKSDPGTFDGILLTMNGIQFDVDNNAKYP